MKNNVFAGIIFLATLLISYHFYYAHAVKGMYPTELVIAIVIMLGVGFGVLTKLVRLKNA